MALLAGCGSSAPAERGPAEQARRAAALVAGIPQSGNTLGAPDAPVRASLYLRLTEADVHLDRTVLPAVLDRYVRSGRMRIQLRTVPTDELAPSGTAEAAARVAQAAGLEATRMWQYALAYRALPAEPDSATRALSYAGVRDGAAVLRAARSGRVSAALARVARRATGADVEVPELLIASGDGVKERVPLAAGPSVQRVLQRIERAMEAHQDDKTSR